jgi:hypothetical protein
MTRDLAKTHARLLELLLGSRLLSFLCAPNSSNGRRSTSAVSRTKRVYLLRLVILPRPGLRRRF